MRNSLDADTRYKIYAAAIVPGVNTQQGHEAAFKVAAKVSKAALTYAHFLNDYDVYLNTKMVEEVAAEARAAGRPWEAEYSLKYSEMVMNNTLTANEISLAIEKLKKEKYSKIPFFVSSDADEDVYWRMNREVGCEVFIGTQQPEIARICYQIPRLGQNITSELSRAFSNGDGNRKSNYESALQFAESIENERQRKIAKNYVYERRRLMHVYYKQCGKVAQILQQKNFIEEAEFTEKLCAFKRNINITLNEMAEEIKTAAETLLQKSVLDAAKIEAEIERKTERIAGCRFLN